MARQFEMYNNKDKETQAQRRQNKKNKAEENQILLSFARDASQMMVELKEELNEKRLKKSKKSKKN